LVAEYTQRIRNFQPPSLDLLPVVRNHVYHPEFGVHSPESRSSCFVPEMTYEGMAVPNGQAAGIAWQTMMGVIAKLSAIKTTGSADYCGQTHWPSSDFSSTPESLQYLNLNGGLLRLSVKAAPSPESFSLHSPHRADEQVRHGFPPTAFRGRSVVAPLHRSFCFVLTSSVLMSSPLWSRD